MSLEAASMSATWLVVGPFLLLPPAAALTRAEPLARPAPPFLFPLAWTTSTNALDTPWRASFASSHGNGFTGARPMMHLAPFLFKAAPERPLYSFGPLYLPFTS